MNRKQIKRIKGNLRKIASQIVRQEALKVNRCKAYTANRKLLLHHTCAICGGTFRPDKVEIDHIEEVGPFEISSKKKKNTVYGDCRVTNWQEWMDRLFCSLDNFQVLCIACHQKKTLGFSEYTRYGGDLL